MPKPLTVWITVNCGKFWGMGIPDHLTCLLRNLYTGQEATVRTGQGTTDWFQIGKAVCQGWILSPCLFNFYAEYIMRKAGWKKHKLKSRLPGEISITSDMQLIPPSWQKAKRNKTASWWRWNRRVKKLAQNSTFKNRYKEQSLELCGRRRGWDDLRE